VHHHTIQINQPTRCNNFSSLLLDRPARPRTWALLPPRSNAKTRGCYCSWWAPDDGR